MPLEKFRTRCHGVSILCVGIRARSRIKRDIL